MPSLGMYYEDHSVTDLPLTERKQLLESVYKGHVTLGISGEAFQKIRKLPQQDHPLMNVPTGNENAIWVQPKFVCAVKI